MPLRVNGTYGAQDMLEAFARLTPLQIWLRIGNWLLQGYLTQILVVIPDRSTSQASTTHQLRKETAPRV